METRPLILFFKPHPLLKASLGPGEHWVTLRPHGPGTKGVPVLIRDQPDGSARVIGGAGGRLNYLKLKGVKRASDYTEEVRQKAEARKAIKKQQQARDKELGIDKAKRERKAAIQSQAREQEKAVVERMAKRLGLKPEELAFDRSKYEHLSTAAQNKAYRDHHKALLKRVNATLAQGRERLLADREARLEAFGEMPLTAKDPASLLVADLDATRSGNALGFAPQYKARAEAQGATEEVLRQEREARQPPEKKDALDRRRAHVEAVKQELARVDKEERPATQASETQLSPRDIVELMKDQKQLKTLRKKTREALGELDEAEAVEPKAYVLDVEPARDADIVREIEQDLRTVRTRAFLDVVGESGGDTHLGRHLGVGAYHSLNRLSLASTGASLVDRSVVDVLGIGGAAQVLARRLRQDLGEDQTEQIRQALEKYHIEQADTHAEAVLAQARADLDAARAIEIPEAVTGQDLEEALALNAHRQAALDKARHALGTALGEFEANAALSVALGRKGDEGLTVPMGRMSAEAAIQRARAIGLEPGDYSIESIAGQHFLTVTGPGLDKLAAPVDPADIAQVRENIAIMKGERDEEDWLPEGFANRPDLAMDIKPGAAPRLAEPFAPGPDLKQSIEDYIGARAADGDPPADILADLLSEDLTKSLSDAERASYFQHLKALAPTTDEAGKMMTAEAHQARFEALADAFVQRRYGMDRSPLHRQSVPLDQISLDAVHRALAAHPEGVAAFKPIGELTNQDQRALRAVFEKDFSRGGAEVKALEADLAKLDAEEPAKTTEDMFGTGTNPAWTDWKARREAQAEVLSRSTLTWAQYGKIMRGTEHAYAAMQDVIKGRVAKEFVDHYNRLRPGSPVKLGRTVLSGHLNHLDAVDPAARESRLSEQRALIDSLRERVAGRYASGSVHEKMDAARDARAAFEQNQMGFFSAEPEPEDAPKPLKSDQRHTLGHRLERQMAGIVDRIGGNFRPGQPVKIWKASMSGKYINQQRAIRSILHAKRVALALAAGSGKTAVALGAFTHLHSQGKVKRGIFVVPSSVQSQVGGEALRYLDSSKGYKWHAEPGASREERIAAYKDPSNHFVVVTHQAFRDDLLHLAAQMTGARESDMANRLDSMGPKARREFMKKVMDKNGLDHDFVMADEAHALLRRAGKKDSALTNTIDAFTDNVPYYVNATADPIKNDVSEAHSVLQRMDPNRYADRAAFMRKYGADIHASKEALRWEMARHIFSGKVDTGVKSMTREVPVKMSEDQNTRIAEIESAVAEIRKARLQGRVALESIKKLSPRSFEGLNKDQQIETAKSLSRSIGVVRDSALKRIIDDGAKTDKVAELVNERKGSSGIVFAHSIDHVKEVAERLRKEGRRVVTLTGADSADQRRKAREAFNPESGAPAADIIVLSDAGAVGLNLQRAEFVIQVDQSNTAMTASQRNARAVRLGQKNNVELLSLIADHPLEQKARQRLLTKYALKDVMTSSAERLDDTGLAQYLKRMA